MDLTSNYFEIFSIPVSFQIDRTSLDVRYRKLQQECHPDRFASKSDVDKRLAIQTAAVINQAYETLKSPLQRAQYMLRLEGVDSNQESHVTSDGQFLMQQIELRELLSEVSDADNPFALLDKLRSQVDSSFSSLQKEFEALYGSGDYNAAFDSVAKMQFFSKLLDEVELLEHELED